MFCTLLKLKGVVKGLVYARVGSGCCSSPSPFQSLVAFRRETPGSFAHGGKSFPEDVGRIAFSLLSGASTVICMWD